MADYPAIPQPPPLPVFVPPHQHPSVNITYGQRESLPPPPPLEGADTDLAVGYYDKEDQTKMEQDQEVDKVAEQPPPMDANGDLHQKPEEQLHSEGRVSPVPSPPPPPPPLDETETEISDHKTRESPSIEEAQEKESTPPPPLDYSETEDRESPPPPKEESPPPPKAESPPPPKEESPPPPFEESPTPPMVYDHSEDHEVVKPPPSPIQEESSKESSPEPYVHDVPSPVATEERSSPEPEMDHEKKSPGYSDEVPASDHEEDMAPVVSAPLARGDSSSSDDMISPAPIPIDESPIPSSSPEADESTLEREQYADHEGTPEVNPFVHHQGSDTIETVTEENGMAAGVIVIPPGDTSTDAAPIVEKDQTSSKKKKVKENGQLKKPGVVVSAGYRDEESGGCCPEPENVHRGNWDHWWEFPLVALGFVMNLGTIMRFPAMFQKHGGAAFLIPYAAFLLFMGLPLVCLQFYLGQYNSSSVIGCFLYAPFYQGVGLAMLIAAAFYAIYNTILMSWSAFYLYETVISALKGEALPWSQCGNGYNTPRCVEITHYIRPNGSFAEREYFFDRLRISSGINEWSELRIDLLICAAAVTGVVVLCCSCGVKSIGKAAYVTTLVPLCLLVAFLIRAATMSSRSDSTLATLDLKALADGPPWKDAAILVFYTFLPGFGGLMTLASFNRFHTDFVCHTVVVGFGGFIFSFLSAVIMFLLWDSSISTYGGIDSIENYTFSDFRLFFVGMARLLSILPSAPIWTALYFLWLILIGLGTQMVMIFVLTTSIVDAWKVRWFLRPLVAFFVCVAIYALHLTLPTDAGYYVLFIMFKYIESWSVMLIVLIEVVSLVYMYSFKKVWNDIELMVRKSCMCLPWTCCSYYWLLCWIILTPLCVAFGVVYWWVDYSHTVLDNKMYPIWADILGWLTAFTLFVAFLVVAIASVAFTGGTVHERFSNAHTPFKFWGPALLKHRQRVDHIPGFVRDPWEEGEDIELTKTTKTNY